MESTFSRFRTFYTLKTSFKRKQTNPSLTRQLPELKKLILIRHLGPIQRFWLFWQNMSLGHVAGQNINSLQKTECKNFAKLQS
jgi:hypothetical protein